jgi:hypothetical protein
MTKVITTDFLAIVASFAVLCAEKEDESHHKEYQYEQAADAQQDDRQDEGRSTADGQGWF